MARAPQLLLIPLRFVLGELCGSNTGEACGGGHILHGYGIIIICQANSETRQQKQLMVDMASRK